MSPFLPNKIRIPPSGTLTIKNTYGKPIKIRVNQTCGLGSIIFWKGHESFEYTDIFKALIKKVDTFFDIGANIGYYTLLAASENAHIRIVSFEPASGPLHYLRANVELNQFEQVRIESIALSDSIGTIEFHEIKNKKYQYLEHCLAGESNTGSKTTGRNYQINSVSTTTLNEYVRSNDIQSIDLIKMDTEGTEHYILRESSRVLGEMKPIVICETLFNCIESDLEEIFLYHGYEFYNHTPNGLQKVATIQRERDNGIYNCFFVHPSKEHLIAEFVSI
jgi:FkbM family methyltransferase